MLAVLLLVLVGLIVRAQVRKNATHVVAMPEVTREQMQQTILTGEGVTQDNTALQYYFWSQYYYHLNTLSEAEAAAFRLDSAYNETATWEDFFLSSALTTMQETLALSACAQREDFAMPADYESALESTLSRFSTYAEANGFLRGEQPDVDAYLQASYGPCADEMSFRAYLQQSYLATAYADTIYETAPEAAEAQYEYYRNAVRTAVSEMNFVINEANIVIAHPSLAE